ncbi:MAG: NAD-dependent epimerase/dehydratase family protein, partial [Anaerolineales bacterium]|nr:NAD-dependent epimerase/dehydratase family protein [Anaerolineales bacterium]
VNINGTRNVLELMQELRIPKGVYTSTLAINSDTKGVLADETYHFTGEHLSEYDRTKAEAHKLADEFIAKGLPLVIVQPGLIYGPGDTSSVRASLLNLFGSTAHAAPPNSDELGTCGRYCPRAYSGDGKRQDWRKLYYLR